MIRRGKVLIQSYSSTKNAQGIVVKTFSTFKTISAAVQPTHLNEVQAQAWGVNAQSANARLMLFDPDYSIHELFRVIIGGMTYEIRAINPWGHHHEALLIPVSGVAMDQFCISPDVGSFEGSSYAWLDDGIWTDMGTWHD